MRVLASAAVAQVGGTVSHGHSVGGGGVGMSAGRASTPGISGSGVSREDGGGGVSLDGCWCC